MDVNAPNNEVRVNIAEEYVDLPLSVNNDSNASNSSNASNASNASDASNDRNYNGEDECVICLLPMDSSDIVKMGCCKNNLHAKCYIQCMTYKKVCPLCRHKVDIILPNTLPNDTVVCTTSALHNINGVSSVTFGMQGGGQVVVRDIGLTDEEIYKSFCARVKLLAAGIVGTAFIFVYSRFVMN